MQHLKTKQGGFGAIGIILILLVVTVIGGAGWLVYNKKISHSKNAPTVVSKSPELSETKIAQPEQSATSVDQNVVKIPELGIQLTVSDSIKDLTYQTKTVTLRNGSKDTIAFFSTASLTAADKDCGPQNAPLGSLGRVDGQYPTQSEDETNVLDYGQLVKQFPTYYIAAGIPNGGACSKKSAEDSSASINTTAGAQKSSFTMARSSVEELN